MFFQFVLCVCVLYLLWKVYAKGSSDGPPVIAGRWPLIGHGYMFMGGSVGTWNAFKKISDESSELGGVARFYLGSRPMYAVSDPEDCLTVSNLCLQRDKIFRFAKPFLGDGLILSSVPTWKKHRKLLNPAFNQQVLNSFVDVFNKQARRLVDQYMPEVGKEFDHEHQLRFNNLETICITATGVGDEFKDLQKQYLPCMENMLKLLTERFQKLWLHSDLIFNWSSLKKRQDEVVKNFHHLSSSIVKQKKLELKTRMISGDLEDYKQGKPKPFMDLILQLANDTNCFTDEEIREETDNIIAGGHDSSASHLTFAFLVLGSYPQIQQKVYDEIIEVVGKSDKDLDKEDISKLVYIDAVLKETLRLYPIAPFLGRYVDREVKLKKYTLKANTGCFLLPYGSHRHPVWGPDANEFRPERRLDQSTLPDLSYFAGFGLGRRACIGRVHAMMSMKIIVAHLVRRYRIKSDISQLKLKMDVVMRPEGGHHITLELRNKALSSHTTA